MMVQDFWVDDDHFYSLQCMCNPAHAYVLDWLVEAHASLLFLAMGRYHIYAIRRYWPLPILPILDRANSLFQYRQYRKPFLLASAYTANTEKVPIFPILILVSAHP